MDKRKQVDNQIKEEYSNFCDAAYSGKGTIPEIMIEAFKKGVYAMPAFSHKVSYTKIKYILGRKKEELSHSDLQVIIKVVLNTPLDSMFKNFDQALISMIQIEEFIVKINFHVDFFKNSLEEKRQRLLKLAGVSNGNSLIVS